MKFILNNPVTVIINSKTFTELNYTVIDNGISATAAISGLAKRLVLWNSTTTPTYEEIGDYTQSQIESRMIELLANPEEVIQSLVSDSQRLAPPQN